MISPEQSACQGIKGIPPCTVGSRAYDGIPDVLRPFGDTALLIGGHRALRAGLALLQGALNGSGIRLTVSPFDRECTLSGAQAYAKEAQSTRAAVILGMGGGKALDTAKVAAHLAGLPVITLPTIPATCAAVTALSVLHEEGGSVGSPFLFLDQPPKHAFLHTGVLSASPAQYLRAGIGDSLAKHVESAFKAGDGSKLSYPDRLGLAAARMGYDTLLDLGVQALADAELGLDTEAYRTAVMCCIINTGVVSLLVQERLNGALAHSLFYALRDNPVFAGFLHGDVVAWGSAVQLMLERKPAEASRLLAFLKALGVPPAQGGCRFSADSIRGWAALALQQTDMADTPCPVDEPMVLDAVERVEFLKQEVA